MSRKKWVVKGYDKAAATALAEELNISPYAALLASARGIKTVQQAKEFFGFSSPSETDPMDFPDMYGAVKRIRRALDNFERIAVYGDYDADGVTATALLYSYLEMQGADVVYYVPDRLTEGYGLSYSAIDNISRMGVRLIITVDNGISAVEEAEYIKQLEMDLIITDHHLPGERLPEAAAVVDPHRQDCQLPFKDYAGVGVAYKLICAVENEQNELTESFKDLAAIGTVADVMPLHSENRSIVKRGIELLNDTERPGLQALINIAGYEDKELKSGSVAFGLAPRINAAGRMGMADRAIKLLLCDDYDEAAQLAEEINGDNITRQQTEQEILSQAAALVDSHPDWQYKPVLVVGGEGWHEGVVGIVAARLVEKYGKPAFVISVNGETAKGSGRSIEGFNLYAALQECADTLTNYGGHTLAAGVGLKSADIPLFRQAINAYAEKTEMPVLTQPIDFKLNPSCVNTELLDVIESLEPFGTGNPQPIFGLYNMTVTRITPIGSGKHLRIALKRDETVLNAVWFRMTQLDFPFSAGDSVDVAACFDANEYLGQVRVNILIKNMKLHSMNEDELFAGARRFNRLMNGEAGDYTDILPDRSFTALVYKFIRSHDKWRCGNEFLCHRLGLDAKSYAKLCVAVQALKELGIIVTDENGSLTLPKENIKVNLDDAPVLLRIRGRNKKDGSSEPVGDTDAGKQ